MEAADIKFPERKINKNLETQNEIQKETEVVKTETSKEKTEMNESEMDDDVLGM